MLFEFESILKELPWPYEIRKGESVSAPLSAAICQVDACDEHKYSILVLSPDELHNAKKVYLQSFGAVVCILEQGETLGGKHSTLVDASIYSTTKINTITSIINSTINLMYSLRMQNNLSKIIRSLGSGGGLQTLTDLAYEIFQNPISVSDTSFKILASSRNSVLDIFSLYPDNLYISAAAESVEKRIPNQTSIDFLRESGRFERALKNSEPYILSREQLFEMGYDIPIDFMDCGIFIKSVPVAIVTLAATERPFQDSDLEYLRQISSLITMELQKDEIFVKNYGIAYETIMTDLLNGDVSDGLQIRLRLQHLDRTLGEELFVAVIRRNTDNDVNTSIPKQSQSIFRAFFPNSISVIYRDDIVLLCNKAKGIPEAIRENKKITDLLDAGNMTLGISDLFRDPIKMKKYYDQSIKAIELGQQIYPSESRCYNYYDISFFHAMEIAARSIKLRDLAHPIINELNDSDRSGDKELLKTLYLWLIYDKDADLITDKLHIARSTLFYRLNKIRDLIGSDLSDGNLQFQLMLSFKLAEYYTSMTDPDAPYWFKELL